MTETATPLPTAAACFPNIGPRGRRLRYVYAGVAILLAVGGAARIAALRMTPIAMIGPAVAFFAAALCFFQAREKT